MKKSLLKIYYFLLKTKENVLISYNKKVLSKKFKPNVAGTDETIERILNGKTSMSRFGDGEFSLINGENLKFQPYDRKLAYKLKEVLVSELDNHVVCIPNVFNGLKIYTDEAENYWEKYLSKNLHKLKNLNLRKKYYDSLVTRLYMDVREKILVDKRFEKIRSIWAGRDIVIIEGEKSRLGIGNDLFKNARTIKRIVCPSINAYSKYNLILDEAKKISKEELILIALGPTATVLSYDLSRVGYQALDIGHIDIEYEWYLSKVTSKTPVKYKYIGEVKEGDIVEEILDREYERQKIKEL